MRKILATLPWGNGIHEFWCLGSGGDFAWNGRPEHDASSLGLFVANWGKWSFTLNPLLVLAYILRILYFHHVFGCGWSVWCSVNRRSLMDHMSHLVDWCRTVGLIVQWGSYCKKSHFSFPQRCLNFSNKLDTKLLFNACAVTSAQISHQCRPEYAFPNHTVRRTAYA